VLEFGFGIEGPNCQSKL